MINLVIERLDRIEKKIDGNVSNRYLDINQTADFTSLSVSTLRRAVNKGELKCSRKLGKLLFQESDIRRWLNG
jgi:predicted DNA-binding transcriptional regulator AlpA